MDQILDCDKIFTAKKTYDQSKKVLEKSKTYEVAVEVQRNKKLIRVAIDELLKGEPK